MLDVTIDLAAESRDIQTVMDILESGCRDFQEYHTLNDIPASERGKLSIALSICFSSAMRRIMIQRWLERNGIFEQRSEP